MADSEPFWIWSSWHLQGISLHILFYSNGLAIDLSLSICQISGIINLNMAILNLIELIFFKPYPTLKPHILFYFNGLAIWHGSIDTKHIKVNYGRWSAIEVGLSS